MAKPFSGPGFRPPAHGAVSTDGEVYPLFSDADGNLLIAGALTLQPEESDTISAAGPQTVGTAPVELLAANSSRLRLILQNVGTTKIWILFGTGVPSSSNYHIALPAGGSANDGSSPVYIDMMWTGEVQAISSAAGGSCQAAENT